MKDEDKKILTEFLGECWYEKCTGVKAPWGTVYPSQDTSTDPNRTFNTWGDFGALIERVEEKDQWDDLFLFGYLPYHKTEGPLIILKAINAGVIK